MFSADAVANEFLRNHLGEIDPMKLQKLVYYAHAWHLALYGTPLIRDDIEAWPHGPVVPSLYAEFKDFRSNPITRLARAIAYRNGSPVRIEPSLDDDIGETPDGPARVKAQLLIAKIWNLLGGFSGVKLSNLSHDPTEPWFMVASQFLSLKPPSGTNIPNHLIRDCFSKKLRPAG